MDELWLGKEWEICGGVEVVETWLFGGEFVGACDMIAIWGKESVVVVLAEDTSFGDVSEDSLKENDCSSKMIWRDIEREEKKI